MININPITHSTYVEPEIIEFYGMVLPYGGITFFNIILPLLTIILSKIYIFSIIRLIKKIISFPIIRWICMTCCPILAIIYFRYYVSIIKKISTLWSRVLLILVVYIILLYVLYLDLNFLCVVHKYDVGGFFINALTKLFIKLSDDESPYSFIGKF